MKDQIKVLITEEQLKKRIKELANEMNQEYKGMTLHMICILKGGVLFMSDLVREIETDVTMDFMTVSSYGDATVSSGNVKIIDDLHETIEGKNVIIIEDIIDSGNTLSEVVKMLHKRNPNSIHICTLLRKPERIEVDLKMDFVGFDIENEFVVGYGLDYQQKYRNLPYIGVIV